MFNVLVILFAMIFIIVFTSLPRRVCSFLFSTKDQRNKIKENIKNIKKHMKERIEIKKGDYNDRILGHHKQTPNIKCVYKNYQSGYVILQAVTKSNKFGTRRKYFAIGDSKKYIIIRHDFEPLLSATDNYRDVNAKLAYEDEEQITIPEKWTNTKHYLIILKSRICLNV